ncbi:MAG: hypothetical protein ACLP59_34865 [Bryobacteraceae bacterium]
MRAGPLGEIALEGLAGPLRVLDIAAGHGLFGIEVARLNREARANAAKAVARQRLRGRLHRSIRCRTCIALLKKVHAALKPGGRAATLEFVPNEDRVSPPMAAAFSLSMLASTPAGDAYTLRD